MENKTKDNNSLQATDYCYCLVLYQLRKTERKRQKHIKSRNNKVYKRLYRKYLYYFAFVSVHLSDYIAQFFLFLFLYKENLYMKSSVHSGNLRLNEDIKENDDCIFNLFYFLLLYCKWDIFIIIFKYFPGIKWLNVYYKELFGYIILQRIYNIQPRIFYTTKINSRELFFDISNLLINRSLFFKKKKTIEFL